MKFLEPFFQQAGPLAYGYDAPKDFVREVETLFQVALPWGQGDEGATHFLFRQVQADRALLARVLDFALSEMMLGYEARYISGAIRDLSRALARGSNYEVVPRDPQRGIYGLRRRTEPATSQAVSMQTTQGDDPARHLDAAWQAAFGRDPDPATAYSEAVKAVEAVAIPVVSPNHSKATLGTVLGELRANPSKFESVFETDAEPRRGVPVSPVEAIIALADLLWKNQTERHAPVVPVTQAQAESAAHIALVLVQAFRSAITPR
jgi:hypothetical protein